MNSKYEITTESKDFLLTTFYRIKALRDFNDVKVGDLGGWIQNEANLSIDGNARVFDNAWVFDNARVCDNAWVSDNALVCGNAWVFDNAWVSGNSRFCDASNE